MALWLICERNTKLKSLELVGNKVGATKDDAPGLSRMLSTSSALETLRLGNNLVRSLPHRSIRSSHPPAVQASSSRYPLPHFHAPLTLFTQHSHFPCIAHSWAS